MKNKLASETKNKKKSRFPIVWLGVFALFIIIVANIIVWNKYFENQGQVQILKDEITLVNEKISQTAEPPSDLESRLEIVKDDLEIARQVFPQNVDGNDVVDFILNTAEECQVQIVPLVSEGWGTERQSYTALKYHGTVTGSLAHATNFMTMLRSSKYPTMIITQCTIKRITAQNISIPESDIEVTIDLVIALYASSIQGNEDTAS
jgi:hypothetical protein